MNKKKFFNIFKNISWGIITIATLIGIIYAATKYIDFRVNEKVNNPEFLRQLSHSLRPAAIFNDKGSILIDMGGMEYVEDLRVLKIENLKLEILLIPKEHLNLAPIIECLDGIYRVSVKRGKKYEWIYNLVWMNIIGGESVPEIENARFRIEILK